MDTQIEQRAGRTLFFREADGSPRKDAINPLKFMSLNPADEAQAEIAKLREIVSRAAQDDLERDIGYLLDAENWRAHLVACMAILIGARSERTLAALWGRLRKGSWSYWQVAATACIADQEFDTKARILIVDRTTPWQVLLSLAALVKQHLPLSETQRANIAQARAQGASEGAPHSPIGWMEAVTALLRDS